MSDNPSVMEFTVDLNDQEEPQVLPDGEYPTEIVEASFKVSQNSGNTYLALRLHITPDAYPADFQDGDPDGTDLNYNRIVVKPETAQTRWRLKKFLSTVGAPIGRTLDPSVLIGLGCTVRLEQSEYDGEKRAEAKKVVSG